MRILILSFFIPSLCFANSFTSYSKSDANKNNHFLFGLQYVDAGFDYTVENKILNQKSSDTTGIERTIIGGSYIISVNDKLLLSLNLGYVSKIETGDFDESSKDSGVLVGAHVKPILIQKEKFSLHGQIGGSFIYEKLSDDIKGYYVELDTAIISSFHATENFQLFAGIHIYPWSTGHLDINDNDSEISYDRDDVFSFKFGAGYDFRPYNISIEAGIIGERSLSMNFGLAI